MEPSELLKKDLDTPAGKRRAQLAQLSPEERARAALGLRSDDRSFVRPQGPQSEAEQKDGAKPAGIFKDSAGVRKVLFLGDDPVKAAGKGGKP